MDEDDFSLRPVTEESFKKIGGHILDGLTEEEACVVENVPLESLMMLMERDPVAANFIRKKKIEFKKKHLEIVNDKKDAKNSIWLLERLMPEQFGSKKAPEVDPTNVLALFVKQVQFNGPNLPVKQIEAEGDDHSTANNNIVVKDFLR